MIELPARPADTTVPVEPRRIARWVENFGSRHGGVVQQAHVAGLLRVRGMDDAVAELAAWAPPGAREHIDDAMAWVSDPRATADMVARAHQSCPGALLIVRRGGFAAARVDFGEVVTSARGSRYVQSRTAAGGWSQQRYARRRANQAQQLVQAARQRLTQVDVAGCQYLALGGDHELIVDVIDGMESALRQRIQDLPRRALRHVADPNQRVLAELAHELWAVTARIWDPSE